MIDALVFDLPVLTQTKEVHQVRKRRNRGGSGSNVRSYAPVYWVGMILLLGGGGDGQPPAYCEVVSVDPLLCIPVQ